MKKERTYNFQIVVENAGGGFSAFSPDLPGCIATGKTRAGARRNMQAAIRIHLQGMKEDKMRTVKCGNCGIVMRKTPEVRMGLKITIQECPHCGKRLISMDDAIRLQERTLKGRKKNGGGKTTTIAAHSIGPDRAEIRIREIQKSLGAEARRKGITKRDLLKALEKTRKRQWAD